MLVVLAGCRSFHVLVTTIVVQSMSSMRRALESNNKEHAVELNLQGALSTLLHNIFPLRIHTEMLKRTVRAWLCFAIQTKQLTTKQANK